jgi:hypothetical protein
MATCASWEPLFGFASLLLACLPRDRRNLLRVRRETNESR